MRVSITYSHQERDVAQTTSSFPSGDRLDRGLLVEDVTRAGSPARLFSGFGGHHRRRETRPSLGAEDGASGPAGVGAAGPANPGHPLPGPGPRPDCAVPDPDAHFAPGSPTRLFQPVQLAQPCPQPAGPASRGSGVRESEIRAGTLRPLRPRALTWTGPGWKEDRRTEGPSTITMPGDPGPRRVP